MPLIAIDENDKTLLDEIARNLAVERGVKSVTYAEVIAVVLEAFKTKLEGTTH